MDKQPEVTDEVRIDISLTIDGDWRSDPLKLMAGLREGSRSLDRWQRKAIKAARKQARAGTRSVRRVASAGRLPGNGSRATERRRR